MLRIGQPEDHPRPGHRGRLQRPVRPRPARADEYYVIEVNPRVSRSLRPGLQGHRLPHRPRRRQDRRRASGWTRSPTPSPARRWPAFEPALDYIVVKIPRWPFDKFATGDRTIGTQMKATGEVMAIDRTFEAALQKAVRSLEFGKKSLLWEDPRLGAATATSSTYPLHAHRRPAAVGHHGGAAPRHHAGGHRRPHRHRPLVPGQARRTSSTWRRRLLSEPLTPDLLRAGQAAGLLRRADRHAGRPAARAGAASCATSWNIRPVYKMVDTCAAEFDAATPYFYSTYEQENEAAPHTGEQGAWSSAAGRSASARASSSTTAPCTPPGRCRTPGYKSIMINSNPETVSTDFDTTDRLYFEPLDEESVRDILENEAPAERRPPPSIVQFGGQTAINLAEPLSRAGMPILGSSADAIDLAEDRDRFEDFLQRPGHPPAAGRRRHLRRGGAERRADSSATRCWCAPATSSAGGRWRSSTTPASWSATCRLAMELDTGHPILIDKYLEGKEVRGRRHLRRRGRAHPRHHGAHRARRRAQRRLHGGLSRRQPDRARGRHHRRLRRAHRPGAEGARA